MRDPSLGPLGTTASHDQAESWALHAERSWSDAHIETSSDNDLESLQDTFRALTDISTTATYRAAHRWRYTLVYRPLREACEFDQERGIGICGDCCLAGRIKAAFQYGAALASRILS